MNNEVIDILKDTYNKNAFKTLLVSYINKSLDSIIVDYCISTVCQLNCKHCYWGEQNINNNKNLTYYEWTTIIKILITKGIKHHHFPGREPSASIDTIRLLKRINKEDSKNYIGFITNGMGDENFYSSVKNIVNYIEFSIEGNHSHNDYIRGKDNFARVLNLIRIQSINFVQQKVNISTTITKSGMNNYLLLLSTFNTIGVNKFFITHLLNSGNATQYLSNEHLDAFDWICFIDKIRDYLNKNNLGISIKIHIPHNQLATIWNTNSWTSTILKDFLYNKVKPYRYINNNCIELIAPFIEIKFLNQICIDFYGDVYSCSNSASTHKDKIGNILTDGIDNIIKTRNKFITNQFNKYLL